MTPRVLIPCAGDRTRWGEGTPKQLVAIRGETLLHRTARQCREAGAEVIVVARPHETDLMVAPGALTLPARLNPDNGGIDRFISSQHLWGEGRTFVLFGDVWFSDETIARIFDTSGWRAFARPGPSRVKPHGELFGHAFDPPDEEHEQALLKVVELDRAGVIRHALGWHHYRVMCGVTDINRRDPELTDRMLVVDDATEDFDKREELDRWFAVYGDE